MVRFSLLAVTSLLLPAALGQRTATIRVEGIAGKAATLSISDLSKLPQQTIRTSDGGSAAIYQGVRLYDVLAMVIAPAGAQFSDYGASYYVAVAAPDRSETVFSWV